MSTKKTPRVTIGLSKNIVRIYSIFFGGCGKMLKQGGGCSSERYNPCSGKGYPALSHDKAGLQALASGL